MLIKIISGTVGIVPYNADGTRGVTVRSKTRFDPPFELDDEAAQDLIARGVAVAVDAPTVAPTADATIAPKAAQTDADDAHEEAIAMNALKDLTNAELKQMCNRLGIDTSKLRTKSQLIAAIEASGGLLSAEDPQ